MRMTEIKKRLVRIAEDLDAVSQEIWERGLAQDWDYIEEALTKVGQVCIVFFDEDELERHPSIPECVRPVPGQPPVTRRQVLSILAAK